MIVAIDSAREKEAIARAILEGLPEWFGIAQAREAYIQASVRQPFFAAMQGDQPMGFLCLSKTGKDTVEVAVMAVAKACHRQGIGRQLLRRAKEQAIRDGFSFMQVKTVQMGRYDVYDRTNRFYISQGFKEFEVFPNLWDEWNPCQVYVMALAST